MGNTIDRMQKKIDKREKYYSKLEKQIERQANAYKNSANMFFSNQLGLGCNGVNLGNYMGGSAAAMQILQEWDGTNQITGASYNKDLVNAILQGNYQRNAKTSDNEATTFTVGDNSSVSEADFNAAQAAIQNANSAVSQRQTMAQQYKANYENNVSIWQEAQLEQLEAQRDWEMDLLAEEQADLEAEKTSIEAQLSLAEERKKAIEQQLGQSIQDAAPKFGLA